MQRSGTKDGRIPQPCSTEQRGLQVREPAHPNFPQPAQESDPHVIDLERPSKTFQTTRSELIVAKPTGEKRAVDTQTRFPLPTHPCTSHRGATWQRQRDQFRQSGSAGGFWLQEDSARNAQARKLRGHPFQPTGVVASRPRPPGPLLRGYGAFFTAKQCHPTEMPKAPGVQVRENKSLCFSTTSWRMKDLY